MAQDICAKEDIDESIVGKIGSRRIFDINPRGSMSMIYRGLLESLQDFYVPNKYMFKISGCLIGPTLDDIALITGFPINGDPVSGQDLNHEKTKELCKSLLGKDGMVEGSLINLKYLLDNYQKVPEGEVDLDRYIRVYVLFVMGTLLFCSKEVDTMPSMYLVPLKDVDNIKNYAWGPALLAHTLYQLELSVQKRTKSFATNSIFIQTFDFEYMPSMMEVIYPRLKLEQPRKFPLGAYYSHILGRRSKDNFKVVGKDEVKRAMETILYPQSYNCGIFLLHYVEQFLELASNRTTDFMEQLDQNWFVPSEVSLKKRDDIRTLIYQLLDDAVKEPQPADENVQTKASFSSSNVSPESQGSPRRKVPRRSSTITPMQLNFSQASFSGPSVTLEAKNSSCRELLNCDLELPQDSPCRELRNCYLELRQGSPQRELPNYDLELPDVPHRRLPNWRDLPRRELPLRSKRGVPLQKVTPADYEKK
ncbi:hypothetical protein OROHE_002967 [Orobanche hederae]